MPTLSYDGGVHVQNRQDKPTALSHFMVAAAAAGPGDGPSAAAAAAELWAHRLRTSASHADFLGAARGCIAACRADILAACQDAMAHSAVDAG